MAIAGHDLAVRSLFGSTEHYCRKYPASGKAEIMLIIEPEELERQQEILRAEALAEGLKPRQFSEPFLERTVLQEKVAAYLRPFGVLLLHGSTVAVDGQAYLFTAKCGTGKSTHTRLWCQEFGSRAVMVNDDKPFLAVSPTGTLAYGAPWSGKHGLDTNVEAPLAGICLLERGTENRIEPLAPADALPFLLTQSCSPNAQPLVQLLTDTVPLWQMQCTRDPEAARMANQAMSGAHSKDFLFGEGITAKK